MGCEMGRIGRFKVSQVHVGMIPTIDLLKRTADGNRS